MKKVLIVSQAMEIGGAEKALLGLLEGIDKDRIQVELFLLRHSGELLKYIPKNIILLPEKKEYSMLSVPLKKILKEKKYNIFLGRLKGKLKASLYAYKNGLKDNSAINDEYSHKYTIDYMPTISESEYDLAISFLSPHYFVLEKVKAKKKIAWIHTDYETIEIDINSEYNMWSKYDYIASISQKVTESFLKKFPLLKEKIILFENILPIRYINNIASVELINEKIKDNENLILLSIGRFCKAKNFDNVPNICKRILKAGIKVKWYLIGYGLDEELIKRKIKELELENNVCILGKKENPYPYIKYCDIYIQPSRYEGKCISVIEAQIFHKPVIITKYATSESQLENGIDGIIVPIDNENCAKEIIKIIQNKKLQQQLVEGTKLKDYSNIQEINKLYQILERI